MAIAELSATANDTYVGGTFYMVWWNAGDALHQCGYVVADHATNDAEVIVLGTTTGIPYAVCALQADLDIDTVVTDGVMYEYYALHVGTALRVPNDETAQAYLKGTAAMTSTGVAGMVEGGTTAGLIVGYSLKSVDVAADTYIELIT